MTKRQLHLCLKLLIIYSNIYYPTCDAKAFCTYRKFETWKIDDSLIDLKTRCFETSATRDRVVAIVVTVREIESNPDFGSSLCWANRLVCWPSTGYLHVASGPVKAAAWQGDEIMGRTQTRSGKLISYTVEKRAPGDWLRGEGWNTPLEVGRHGAEPANLPNLRPTILIMT